MYCFKQWDKVVVLGFVQDNYNLSNEPTEKETGVVYYVASQIHSPCNKVVYFIQTTYRVNLRTNEVARAHTGITV